MRGIRGWTAYAAVVGALALGGCTTPAPGPEPIRAEDLRSSGAPLPTTGPGSGTEPPASTPPTAAPTSPPASRPSATASLAGQRVRVLDWIDGDTVDTTAGRVRVIGYDTPERGDCRYEAATRVASRLAPPGSVVVLVIEPANDDTDRYGRLLRRVVASGRDVGIALIRSGYAVARYDSADGYPGHSREAAYRAADAATPDRRCP
jgi:endonuclease YncB( thermonuclease family)